MKPFSLLAISWGASLYFAATAAIAAPCGAEDPFCASPVLRDIDTKWSEACLTVESETRCLDWRRATLLRCEANQDCLVSAYLDDQATMHELLRQRELERLEKAAQGNSRRTRKPGAKKTPADIFTLASRSVVVVSAYGKKLLVLDRASYGSGITISREKVATNCHVIEDMQTISVAHAGARYPAIPLLEEKTADICVLHVPGLPTLPASLRPLNELRPGQIIYVVGNPMNLGLSIANGLLSGIVEQGRIPQISLETKLLQFLAPNWQGNSGGGLFDENGYVIGVPSIRWQPRDQAAMNFAVPLADIGIVRRLRNVSLQPTGM